MKSIRLVTDQIDQREAAIILRELELVINTGVDGDVVEFGCYEGGSAVAMQSVLAKHDYSKKLWLYDSFEGLPEKTAEDISIRGAEFKAGELKASRARLLRNFVKTGLKQPEVKRAWFFELDGDDLPEQIAFAFLDGDFYESVMDSFKLVWPKLSEGGVVVVDDYQNSALPGVKTAVDEWMVSHDAAIKVESSLAILQKHDIIL